MSNDDEKPPSASHPKQRSEHGDGDENRKIGGEVHPKRRKGDNIAGRLLGLSAESVDVARALPTDFVGKHIATQLVRSVTGAAANYEEARAAESRPDFIHKVSVAAKELREAAYWLSLIDVKRFASVSHLLRESDELIAILLASIRTARSRQ